MKAIYFVIPILMISLQGCQSMGDHYSCLAEVDRTVPAQTQQKYVRTDTKCVQSGYKTLTGPFGGNMGTVASDKGDVNCSSVPIYETIVLNEAQRDSAYQQCRGRVNSQRNTAQQYQSNSYPNWTGDTSKAWKDDGGFKPNANWSVENLCSAVKSGSSQKVDAQKELTRRNEKCK